ncbi:hypothetical protein ABFX02_04G161000 [Erythranthe guttata]
MAIPELYQEILIDIFLRLPAKSIGKCRCLSKPWRAFLSSPEFIKSHLARNSHKQNLLLISAANSIHSIDTIKERTNSAKIKLRSDWLEFVGSCDGLILLVNKKGEIFLVNPVTLQQRRVPNSPLSLKKRFSFTVHGFGYDSSTDDYKIVTLSYYDPECEYEPDCVDTFVDVYYVKKGFWRRVENSPYDHSAPDRASGVLLNGALHWLASSPRTGYPSVIAAFDLAHEVFDEIPAPSGMNVDFVFNSLHVRGGCLCMVDYQCNARKSIWIMKEYGLADSWTKYGIGWYDGILKPLCFVGDEEFVLITHEALVVHNVKDGKSRDMVVDGVQDAFIDGGIFVGSLLSPTFSDTSELETVTCEFTQQILIEIFSRLPAKSVGKCRCLSKQWHTILSTPEFIKCHLARKPHQENLLLITPSHSINSIATIKNDAFSEKIEVQDNWIEVLGSCDGLVLLLNEENEKFLVNPVTLQQAKVPDPPVALEKWESFTMHGFGYDSAIDDYKIVSVSYSFNDEDYDTGFVDTFVDVYYVKRGFWKRVENSPYAHTFHDPPSGVFLNGAAHWLASIKDSRHRSVIAAFDLVREVFDEIPAPSGINANFVFCTLVVLGGCLCLVDARCNKKADGNRTDVWVMREYGSAESWTKFSIDCNYYERYIIARPLCYIGGDEEIVWTTKEESLVIYNLKDKTFRDMILDGFPAHVLNGCSFVGSLVSPYL